VLSAVGIYSVLSYIVGGRRQEIGIRTALGATTADVLRSVLVEGMTPAIVGIGVGILAAIGSARLLSTMVWGISASDPATLFTIAVGLALISLLASFVPAYRASRVDPAQVLRGNNSLR
jgi:ABC-type antimicrobial peptide transport system permease subunit